MTTPASAPTDKSPSVPPVGWRLQHTYAQLPRLFHEAVAPTPVSAPHVVVFNHRLAGSLGLDEGAFADETETAAFLAGNRLPPGASPLAQAYSGHQYGHFTTLGDGRAILLGEQITPGGERLDVQLKGSGPTPFSRGGDGRAALGPMLREYIISEAMHALEIPTTRSLAVVATGENVWRPEPLPGAVLTRIAASHIRVGTFEWAGAQGDEAALRALVHYTVVRHYPDLVRADNLALALLDAVIERQATLIAQWMSVGFVHGVMNTDNMALSGETIDYGPCAFIDAYDPAKVFSSIDRQGRYAYGNQPRIAQWNLARLAEALLPLLHPEETTAVTLATEAVQRFAERFQHHSLALMRRKLGLFNEEPDDVALIESLLAWMHRAKADFTNTFAALTHDHSEAGGSGEPSGSGHCRAPDAEFLEWTERWRARLTRQSQSFTDAQDLRRRSNPAFIPRNHLVEAALASAQQGDLDAMHRLLDVLTSPFDHDRNAPEYRSPAPDGGVGYRTFCGT